MDFSWLHHGAFTRQSSSVPVGNVDQPQMTNLTSNHKEIHMSPTIWVGVGLLALIGVVNYVRKLTKSNGNSPIESDIKVTHDEFRDEKTAELRLAMVKRKGINIGFFLMKGTYAPDEVDLVVQWIEESQSFTIRSMSLEIDGAQYWIADEENGVSNITDQEGEEADIIGTFKHGHHEKSGRVVRLAIVTLPQRFLSGLYHADVFEITSCVITPGNGDSAVSNEREATEYTFLISDADSVSIDQSVLAKVKRLLVM